MKRSSTFRQSGGISRTDGSSTKRSSSVGWKATGGSASSNTRPSVISILGQTQRSAADVIRDPRPINDKEYKEQCIRQLLEFLTANKYMYSINARILHCPQKKDFINIFEFLMNFIIPGYKLTGLVEIEVPSLLEHIGYPVAIPRKSLVTIGTMHTWPVILAALTWLRTLIQDMIDVTPFDLVFTPQNSSNLDSVTRDMAVKFCVDCYAAYLDCRDTYDDLKTDLRHRLAGVYKLDVADKQSLMEELKHNEGLLQAAHSLTLDIESKKQLISSLVLDTNNIRKYMDDNKQRVEQLRIMLDRINNDISYLMNERNDTQATLTRREQQIASQDKSAINLKELANKRSNLLAVLSDIEQKNSETEQQKLQGLKTIESSHSKVDSLVTECNLKIKAIEAAGKKLPSIEASRDVKLLLDSQAKFMNEADTFYNKQLEHQHELDNEHRKLLSSYEELLEKEQKQLTAIADAEKQLIDKCEQYEAMKKTTVADLEYEVNMKSKQRKRIETDLEMKLKQSEQQRKDRAEQHRQGIEIYETFLSNVRRFIEQHKTDVMNDFKELQPKFSLLEEINKQVN